MLCFEVGQILYKEYAVIDFKHWRLHCSWGDKAPMSPKRILNVDFSYLPKYTEFFSLILENKNLWQILA